MSKDITLYGPFTLIGSGEYPPPPLPFNPVRNGWGYGYVSRMKMKSGVKRAYLQFCISTHGYDY